MRRSIILCTYLHILTVLVGATEIQVFDYVRQRRSPRELPTHRDVIPTKTTFPTNFLKSVRHVLDKICKNNLHKNKLLLPLSSTVPLCSDANRWRSCADKITASLSSPVDRRGLIAPVDQKMATDSFSLEAQQRTAGLRQHVPEILHLLKVQF